MRATGEEVVCLIVEQTLNSLIVYAAFKRPVIGSGTTAVAANLCPEPSPRLLPRAVVRKNFFETISLWPEDLRFISPTSEAVPLRIAFHFLTTTHLRSVPSPLHRTLVRIHKTGSIELHLQLRPRLASARQITILIALSQGLQNRYVRSRT